MALDTRSKVRLGWIAAALAPVVAVQAVRLLTASGPQSAVAASPSPMPAAAAPTVHAASPATITEEQRRALAWLATIEARPGMLRSPMCVTEPPAAAAPTTIAPVEELPLPTLRLGGVVSRGKDSVASINSRLFAVGDEPAEGWLIQSIDGAKRSVHLRRFDGKRIELTSNGIAELPAAE